MLPKYAVVVLGVCVRLRADWIGTLTADRSTSSAYLRYVRHMWSKIKTAHRTNDSVILASPTNTCRCKNMSSRTRVCGSTEHPRRPETRRNRFEPSHDCGRRHEQRANLSKPAAAPRDQYMVQKRSLSLPGSTFSRAECPTAFWMEVAGRNVKEDVFLQWQAATGSRGHSVRARA